MYSNILVPVAFDGDHPVAPALTVARALASETARITFLHVLEKIPGYAINYMPSGYRDEVKKALTAELADLAGQVPDGKGVLIEGHSGRSILDYADAESCDLIVIASHRPGMQDLLLGSTASQVVRHAACAVHVLR